MQTFDTAVLRDVAILITAIAMVIKAIWPNGIRR